LINVAHFRSYYLGLTETFIYQYLKNFRKINPLVFTLDVLNTDQFPFPEIHMALYRPYFLGNLISRFGRNVLGRDFKVEALIKKYNVSLIHAHFGPDGYHLLSVKKKTGIPLITTFYGYDMSLLPRQKKWMENYQEFFKIGDIFLVEGNHMKKEMIRIGCPEEKIKIQHIAIDLEMIPFRLRTPKTEEEKLIILFCGRFSEKKGLLYALKAVSEVIKSFCSIEFRIIGDGELRQEVDDYVKSANISEWVKLLGVKSHDEVIKELNNADIFLHPSVTASDGDSEGGAPTIILEAQAAGLPVVSTFHADIPEVVIDGKTGFLVKERDVLAIAEKLEYLLMNQELWQGLGKNGREHMRRNYDISKEVEKLENIYFSLVGERT
jgi:colanic acid/amylovoran biosynthesis glycosyltransferase